MTPTAAVVEVDGQPAVLVSTGLPDHIKLPIGGTAKPVATFCIDFEKACSKCNLALAPGTQILVAEDDFRTWFVYECAACNFVFEAYNDGKGHEG